MRLQQSELVTSIYLTHLFPQQYFPVELWWKYSNKNRNFGAKKTVTLKDIYLI